jgi:MATE family multidrug resistance protein
MRDARTSETRDGHGGETGGVGRLGGRFVRLTAINIVSNVTVPLAGLVDTAMLGHLDDIRFLAGVALGSVLFDYVYWSLGFLRMGTTGTVAQEVGRGDRDEVFRVLYRSLTLAAAFGFALLILQSLLREAGFAMLAGEPGVEEAGRAYFSARIWGAPATLANFVLIGWFLGRAESRHVLVMTIACNVANIALNYVFIIRMGLAALGAGLATMAAQYVMLGVGLALLRSVREPVPWRWREVLDRQRLVRLVRLNRDILVRTLLLVSAFALFTNFSSVLGTVVLAANSILIRILVLAAYLIDGAAYAAESLAGICLGARRIGQLRRLGRISLGAGLGFAVAVLAAFFAWPSGWIRVLTSHGELVAIGVRFAPWLIPTLLIGSVAYMFDGLFLGLTEGRALRNAMGISLLAGFLPLALIGLRIESNGALWGSMALFMAARAATLGLAWPALLRRYEA